MKSWWPDNTSCWKSRFESLEENEGCKSDSSVELRSKECVGDEMGSFVFEPNDVGGDSGYAKRCQLHRRAVLVPELAAAVAGRV